MSMVKRRIDAGDTMNAEKKYMPECPSLPAVRDILQAYLVQIRSFPMLTPWQNTELAIRYRETGNKMFASSLATSNLRLVVKIALKYHRKWRFDLMDMIQEGNVGLIQAIKKYDPFRGVKFSYYAVYWIKAYILKYIIDTVRLVKIGTNQTERMLFYNLYKMKNQLEKMGLNTAPESLAVALDTDSKKIIEMEQRLGSREISLDDLKAEAQSSSRHHFRNCGNDMFDIALADNELFSRALHKLEIFKSSLDSRRQEIFSARILSENQKTLETIGEQYGISKERVRQIEKGLKLAARKFLQETCPELQQLAADKGYDAARIGCTT